MHVLDWREGLARLLTRNYHYQRPEDTQSSWELQEVEGEEGLEWNQVIEDRPRPVLHVEAFGFTAWQVISDLWLKAVQA